MEKTITIINRLGLHARAAAKLVQTAARFKSTVRIRKDKRTVSGKSIMGVLMLAAAKGTSLTFIAEGEDAAQALDALTQLVADKFGEDA
ncbi:MAG: HPr family phosphocarrier protein [Pseudomonadota bacterium]